MRNARVTICVVVAVLVMSAGQGFGGLTEFKDGVTYNINYQTGNEIWVDYLAPGMQTTVNLLAEGRITSTYGLTGFNDSRLNISGGSVIYGLWAYERSQVTMSDGWVNDLLAFNNSHVTMSGGRASTLLTNGDSQATMSGGNVNGLFPCGNSQVTMSGGTVRAISSGGSGLVLRHSAKLIIDGFDFAIDESPVGFGEITSIFGGDYINEPYRLLTGTLATGDVINSEFKIGNYASITLVPETTTLLLLGLGAVMLRKRR